MLTRMRRKVKVLAGLALIWVSGALYILHSNSHEVRALSRSIHKVLAIEMFYLDILKSTPYILHRMSFIFSLDLIWSQCCKMSKKA